MERSSVIWLLLLSAMLGACQKELRDTDLQGGPQRTITIRFTTVVDGQAFQFGTPYINPSGEDYSVSTFRYYITGIALADSGRNAADRLSEAAFLVDAADSGSTLVLLKAPLKQYNQVIFTIGIDSARNVSGAQTGALDPAKGMFWTWNSGYIMAKLEGNSSFSGQPGNQIEYHIGGFRHPYNTVKKITLPFPPGDTLSSGPNAASVITIAADISSWFSGAGALRIAATPVCTTPGELAERISRNYAGMFRIAAISNN